MSARTIRRSRERALARRRRSLRKAGLATGAVIASGAIAAPAVQAANFSVTSTNDSGAGSLRQAVLDANAAAGADTITFTGAGASGEITLTSGEIEIQDDLTITGPGAGALAVSGDANTSNTHDAGDSRIFVVIPPGTVPPARQVTISGLTLKEGTADSGPYEQGGAIRALGTYLKLDDVTITGNLATGRGAGVYNRGGSLEMTSSTVTDNRAFGDAAGLFAYSYEDDGIQISDSTFADNEAGNPAPGGPYGFPRSGGLEVRGNGFLRNLQITGNVAAEPFPGYDPTGTAGGALLSANQGDLTITGSTISGNSAAGRAGGLVLDGATMVDSTVRGNDAGYGGGVDAQGASISRSTITDNEAATGGGVSASGDSDTTIRNSTISGNRAVGTEATPYSGKGGGIFAYTESKYSTGDPAQVKVRSSTVAGNSAARRGGNVFAFYDGPVDNAMVEFRGTIVADGTAPGDSADIAQSEDGSISAGFSLIESPAGYGALGDPGGTNIIGVDPKLGPLGNNGGPTQTLAPAPTSAAIDASQAFGLTTDQRGRDRTIDSDAANATLSDGTDIGAVEAQSQGIHGDDDLKKPKVKVKAPKNVKLKAGERTVTAKVKIKAKDNRTAGRDLVLHCKLDKRPWKKCSPKVKLKLDAGKHVLKVRATDEGGNTGRGRAKIKVKAV